MANPADIATQNGVSHDEMNAASMPDANTVNDPGNVAVPEHDAIKRPPRWPHSLGINVTLVIVTLIALLVAGVGVGAAIASSRALTGSSSSPTITSAIQKSVEQSVQTVRPSVVEVTSINAQGEAIGSGEMLTSNGFIVTNDHVVQGFSNYQVTLSNGTTVSAQLTGQDAQDDLAVLKVSASNLKPITFGNSANAMVGEFVIAVGNPLGLEQSATFGIVSALNRTATEAPSGPAGVLTGLIQTSAPINPGNSGGALVTVQGDLIGVPTLSAVDPETNTQANSIGYAIPSERVQYVTDQLMKYGHLVSSGQGFLGI
jgi:S1-C subfamily serine protease